jgi:hypothetical protein
MRLLTWIFVILSISIIGILIGAVGVVYMNESQVFVKNETIEKIQFNNSLSKIDKINQIAWAVANERNYTLGRYDCTQFSKRLVGELRDLGLRAYCRAGIFESDNKRTPHTWVEVNDTELGMIRIEATAGYIIPDDMYNESYRPFWNMGVCW